MQLATVGTGYAASNYLLDVKPIYQYNYPSVIFTYQDEPKSVELAGCGAACVSMALKYFDESILQTPETLLTWALEDGYYTGNGLSRLALKQMLSQYDYQGEWISGDMKLIRKALKNGYPIVARMGAGTFTTGGHYILIVGMDRKNRLSVVDPNSERLSRRKYAFEMIDAETNGTPAYMICSPAEHTLGIQGKK